MICLHRRQTRPSIAGACHSSLAWSSNTIASISLGSTSCITGGGTGSILKFDRNRTVVVGSQGVTLASNTHYAHYAVVDTRTNTKNCWNISVVFVTDPKVVRPRKLPLPSEFTTFRHSRASVLDGNMITEVTRTRPRMRMVQNVRRILAFKIIRKHSSYSYLRPTPWSA